MSKSTVVAILYPGCIVFEIMLALELLAKKYEIVVATPDGEDLFSSAGVEVKTNVRYRDVDLSDCKGVLIPGGDPGCLVQNSEIENLLRSANDKNILLAAICAGPSVLAKAGILKGRRIAHGYEKEQLDFLKKYFEGVVLTDEMFVADGNVLTAKPQVHIDFAVEIACRLDATDASKSGRLKDYYKGVLGRRIRPLALALVRNSRGQMLLHKSTDSLKGETFYRPLGGGVEFHESGREAIEREIFEEIEKEFKVEELAASFENIFMYEGKPGHEIVMLFSGEFADKATYDLSEIDIVESGKVINKAVWRSVEEIRAEGAKLYPIGLDQAVLKLPLVIDQKTEVVDQPTIETERLTLAPYKDSDLQDIFEYAKHPEVSKFVPWESHKTLDDSKKFLDFIRQSTRTSKGKVFFVFAIRLKESGRVIGSFDFKNVNPLCGQIDYALGFDYWNKGIVTEAAQAIKRWALDQFPEMVRFHAFCALENKGSARVMEKIGMQREGVRRKAFVLKGKPVDLVDYSIVR